jgi:hypothetical protein
MNLKEKLAIRILLIIARIFCSNMPEDIRRDLKNLDTNISLYVKEQ